MFAWLFEIFIQRSFHFIKKKKNIEIIVLREKMTSYSMLFSEKSSNSKLNMCGGVNLMGILIYSKNDAHTYL